MNTPPLSSLRAFEAAARTGSLSAAGRELNVTHAAISQHVRNLEAHLETTLLTRDGMRLVPTADGQRLASGLGEGFSQILSAIRDLQADNTTKPLRVSLTPSLAETWLMPRLGRFWRKHPDIQVELAPSTGVVDLKREGFDLAIRYGTGDWPGVDSTPLMSARFIVISAPGLHPVIRGGDLSNLHGAHWILEHLWKEGVEWLSKNGIDIDEERVTLLGTTSGVLQAVRSGHGVSLVSSTTAQSDIEAGALDVLYEAAPGTGGYHIVQRPGASNRAARRFIAWLKQEARARDAD